MARIRWVGDEATDGPAAEIYAAWRAANPGPSRGAGHPEVPEPPPRPLRGMIDVSDRVHFADGHLSRRIKEMIATYVSALNACPY